MTTTPAASIDAPTLSRWIESLEGSPTMALHSKAMELKRQGRDIVNLTAGEPDFDTPDHIRAAAKRAIDEGKTHYTPTGGIPELREAAAHWATQRAGRTFGPDQIVITSGTKFAVFASLASLTESGDDVLIPAPYWVSYPPMVKMVGGQPVPVWAGPDQQFKVTPDDLDRARTPRTRGLIFNSPCNPTGSVYTREETGDIARWAAENGIWIVSDEIYADLCYTDKPYTSIVGLDERPGDWQVLADGLSKSYAMTGWRVGVLAGSRAMANAVTRLAGQTTSCASSISQYAALAAITGPQEALTRMATAFRERRESLGTELRSIPGLGVNEPQGAFYFFLDVQAFLDRRLPDGKAVESAERLCAYLLDGVGVSLMPGEGFGAPGFVRVSYAADTATLQEAARRLRQALETLA